MHWFKILTGSGERYLNLDLIRCFYPSIREGTVFEYMDGEAEVSIESIDEIFKRIKDVYPITMQV